jgi:Fe-S cluster assembly ATP-binding protein
MIDIKNLHVVVEGKEILKGVNLTIAPGEIHAIMGRNGSGKSTLSNVIAGHEKYEVTQGEIFYKGKNLFDLSIEERARNGIFLSFQNPVVLPGVNNAYFLKTALNAVRKFRGDDILDAMDFLTLIRDNLKIVEMDESYLKRPVNDGFSGGEKKRNEILQMITLEPQFAILDETDSGLDIDALKIIARGINNFRDPKRSFLIITHYQRLLKYIEPDVVHVLIDGKIVKSGSKDLALQLEEKGYRWVEQESLTAG